MGLIEEGERNLCSLLCYLFMSEEISLEEEMIHAKVEKTLKGESKEEIMKKKRNINGTRDYTVNFEAVIFGLSGASRKL